jgi:hypothetical protein
MKRETVPQNAGASHHSLVNACRDQRDEIEIQVLMRREVAPAAGLTDSLVVSGRVCARPKLPYGN